MVGEMCELPANEIASAGRVKEVVADVGEKVKDGHVGDEGAYKETEDVEEDGTGKENLGVDIEGNAGGVDISEGRGSIKGGNTDSQSRPAHL